MIYYTEEDVNTVAKQKKKAVIIMLVIIGIYFFISLGLFLWYLTLPYKSSTITTVKLIEYPITAVFVIIMFIYCGVYYRRIKKRFIYQRNMLSGIKETSVGTFLEYSNEVQDKDGVDFKALIFIEWNKYKKDFFERKVLVFNDRPFPEIKENAKVEYTTQSNVLIEYRILGEE